MVYGTLLHGIFSRGMDGWMDCADACRYAYWHLYERTILKVLPSFLLLGSHPYFDASQKSQSIE
jgi:hypothetical protein